MSNNLENRYLVIKQKDLDLANLPRYLQSALEDILERVTDQRQLRGVPPLKCVVIENDWPEYEETVNKLLGVSNEMHRLHD